jgi:hypothetical protein
VLKKLETEKSNREAIQKSKADIEEEFAKFKKQTESNGNKSDALEQSQRSIAELQVTLEEEVLLLL